MFRLLRLTHLALVLGSSFCWGVAVLGVFQRGPITTIVGLTLIGLVCLAATIPVRKRMKLLAGSEAADSQS